LATLMVLAVGVVLVLAWRLAPRPPGA